MCKCEKCGGVVCPDCGRAECATGSDECLQAQIRSLQKKVKELEARPQVPQFTYIPYPQPYIQPAPNPWWVKPTLWYGSNTQIGGMLNTGTAVIATPAVTAWMMQHGEGNQTLGD